MVASSGILEVLYLKVKERSVKVGQRVSASSHYKSTCFTFLDGAVVGCPSLPVLG